MVQVVVSQSVSEELRLLPNPAFKRTHTGGSGLLVSRASDAPARAA